MVSSLLSVFGLNRIEHHEESNTSISDSLLAVPFHDSFRTFEEGVFEKSMMRSF